MSRVCAETIFHTCMGTVLFFHIIMYVWELEWMYEVLGMTPLSNSNNYLDLCLINHKTQCTMQGSFNNYV